MGSESLAARTGRRVVGRILRWVRDLWCVAGLAVAIFLPLDAAVSHWGKRVRGESLRALLASEEYREASGKRDALYLERLAGEIQATHDSPFEATRLRWEPLVYWRGRSFSGELIRIDGAGLRRTMMAQPAGAPRNATAWRVFCFGGSTLWGACVPDSATIASQLADRLAAAGWQVEVTNFAQPGYVSTQERIALEQELARGQRPDVVLFYDGFNDTGAAMAHVEPGLPADEFDRPQRDVLWQHPSLGMLTGHFLRTSAVARALQPSWQEQLSRRIERNLAERTAQRVAAETVDRYVMNVRLVQALERQGFESRFFWQPLVYSRAAPSASERAFLEANAGAREYHRLVCRRMAQVAGQWRVDDPLRERFRDLSPLFDEAPWRESTLFFDACHLADRGNAEVARAMARELESLFVRMAAEGGGVR